MLCKKGVEIVNTSKAIAVIEIIRTARFFSLMTAIKLRVFESEVSIRNIFPIMSDENAIALTSSCVCPSFIERKYTTITIVSKSIPLVKLDKIYAIQKIIHLDYEAVCS